jgi:hypothetical protein
VRVEAARVDTNDVVIVEAKRRAHARAAFLAVAILRQSKPRVIEAEGAQLDLRALYTIQVNCDARCIASDCIALGGYKAHEAPGNPAECDRDSSRER